MKHVEIDYNYARFSFSTYLVRRHGRMVRSDSVIMQKGAGSSLKGPAGDRKTLCQPSSEWVPFSNQERKMQRKEWDGLRHLYDVPRIQSTSNPAVPTDTRL